MAACGQGAWGLGEAGAGLAQEHCPCHMWSAARQQPRTVPVTCGQQRSSRWPLCKGSLSFLEVEARMENSVSSVTSLLNKTPCRTCSLSSLQVLGALIKSSLLFRAISSFAHVYVTS